MSRSTPPAEEAGQGAEHDADDGVDAHSDEAHRQGDPGAVNHPGGYVPARDRRFPSGCIAEGPAWGNSSPRTRSWLGP